MTNAAAPEPKANMGAPAPRYDARLKVTGEARFASDMAVANPAYAVLVTSAIAKGRIASIDLDQARAVPGVLDILTQDNTSELKPVKFGDGSATSIQKLGPEIFHSGQIIAVVIADTFEAASEAANNVKVSYDEQAPAATFGAQGLQEEDATKVSQQHKHLPQAGDADSCDRRRRRYDRRRIRNADPASQSDGAVHDDLRVDRRPPDRVRAEPVRLRPQERRRAAARHRA